MYRIELGRDAIEDLKWFKKHEQNEILDGIEANLRYEPTIETRNRNRLRPNKTTEWELRLGKHRIFYDVDQMALFVSIAAVGLKVGNLLRFRGEARGL